MVGSDSKCLLNALRRLLKFLPRFPSVQEKLSSSMNTSTPVHNKNESQFMAVKNQLITLNDFTKVSAVVHVCDVFVGNPAYITLSKHGSVSSDRIFISSFTRASSHASSTTSSQVQAQRTRRQIKVPIPSWSRDLIQTLRSHQSLEER